MVLAVHFGQDMATISGSTLDFATLFDLEAFDSALDALHLRHDSPFKIMFISYRDRKWDDIIPFPNKMGLRDKDAILERLYRYGYHSFWDVG